MRSLVIFGIKVLEIAFVAGIIGSAVVIILTAVEDLRTIFSKDENERA